MTPARKDERLIDEDFLSSRVAEFLARGGSIQTHRHADTSEKGIHTTIGSGRHNTQVRAAVTAQVKRLQSLILGMHLEGCTLTRIRDQVNGASITVVKRAIYEAGECPARNGGNTPTREQIKDLIKIASEGGTADEASRFARVKLDRAVAAAKDYGFKYKGPTA
jgi:hypothetical protein